MPSAVWQPRVLPCYFRIDFFFFLLIIILTFFFCLLWNLLLGFLLHSCSIVLKNSFFLYFLIFWSFVDFFDRHVSYIKKLSNDISVFTLPPLLRCYCCKEVKENCQKAKKKKQKQKKKLSVKNLCVRTRDEGVKNYCDPCFTQNNNMKKHTHTQSACCLSVCV
jgi:hypothetical protein